jgi:O-antigen/teichoic acid export membrane protein
MNTHTEKPGAKVNRLLAKNILTGSASKIGYLLTRFFIPPFVLMHVGIERYGIWATCFILVGYLGVSTVGISNVYLKYVAEFDARKEYGRANSLLSTGIFITLPLSILLFVGVWFTWPQLISLLHINPALQTDAREVALTVIGVYLGSIGISAFRDALMGSQKISTLQGTWVIGYLLETFFIWYLVSNGRGIRGLVEAFLIRNVVENVLNIILAYRKLPWLHITWRNFDRCNIRTIFHFGGAVQMMSLLAIVLDSIERAIAVPLIGVGGAGLLEIGTKLPTMAVLLPASFSTAFLPAASYLSGGINCIKERASTISQLYLRGARYMNLTAAYICAFLALFPMAILNVWLHQKYEGITLILIVFAVTTQLHLLTGPGTSILKGIGRPWQELRYSGANIVLLSITLPLTRLIFGQWNTSVIAIGVCSATVLASAYFLFHANRLLSVDFASYLRKVLLPGVIPYFAAGLLSWPVNYLVAGSGRWMGFAWLGGAGVLYTVLTFAIIYFGALAADEKAKIGSGWNSLTVRFFNMPDRAKLVTETIVTTGIAA